MHVKVWRYILVAIVIDHVHESQLQDSLSELLLMRDGYLVSSSDLISETM
jgi:hypothetical protein